MTETLAPYNMMNDNSILLLLILNLVGISYVILMNGANIIERAKCIFYYESKTLPYSDRTHITKICNLMMYFQVIFYAMIVLISIFSRRCHGMSESDVTSACITIAALLAAFFLIKRGVHYIVNSILFSKHIANEWDSFYSFTIKLWGFMLTPAVLAVLFIPQIPLKYIEIYSILTVVAYLYTIINGLNKIIFAKKCIYVYIFLYLCALEFLPYAIVWKTMLQLDDFVTIKI